MGNIKKLLIYLSILIFGGIIAFVSAPYLRQFLSSSGFIQEKVLVAGTGSMYPTFPKGEGKTDVLRASEIVALPKMRHFPSGITLNGFNLFSYNLEHGDIVDFENVKTKEITRQKYGDEAGFVKRIIGLPGDSITLRDGFVIVNGQNLDEPYTAKPRSTYGGDFLPDCQNILVPQGKIFVMGDNRKASLDSRFELGFVDIKSIKFVMPVGEQGDYRKSFRDTKEDNSLANTATLDPTEFVKLLNEKRKEKNLPPFKLSPILSLSGKRRGNVMISTNDFSTEATKSGVTLEKALKETGYSNIIFAEIFTRGYYEAIELLDNFLEFPQTKNILFSSQYQEIGLAPVLGEINNCPTQVVVVHLGGYVPPNYKPEDIQSWKKLMDNLNQAIPSWEQLQNNSNVDQSKLNQLLNILRIRKDTANKIYKRMNANLWLSDEEEKLVAQDKQLAEDANSIVDQLSKK
ncbi:signal peptidase I [Candidatus Gottesmanbacteria bacterium]|nr:signal peptidase I [Candidatus Gottesmanbacteria bacterium]